jgi:hypothetical protein
VVLCPNHSIRSLKTPFGKIRIPLYDCTAKTNKPN